MRLTLLSILFIGLASCSRHTIATTTDNIATHGATDSVKIVDHYTYVPYTVPSDTVKLFIPVDCDTLGRVRPVGLSSTNHRASVHAYISNGTLSVESDCHAVSDSLRVSQQTITEIRTSYDSLLSHRVDTIQVKYIPKAYKWAMDFTLIIIAFIGLTIIYKLFKAYTKWGTLLP